MKHRARRRTGRWYFAGRKKRYPCLIALAAIALFICFQCVSYSGMMTVTGLFYQDSPVANARVYVQSLAHDGDVEDTSNLVVAETFTDEEGYFEIDVPVNDSPTTVALILGVPHGFNSARANTLFKLRLQSGTEVVGTAVGREVAVSITPLTALAASWAWTYVRQLNRNRLDSGFAYSHHAALAQGRLSAHLGFDLTDPHLADLTRPISCRSASACRYTDTDEAVTGLSHALTVAALSGVAQRIARLTGLSSQEFSIGHIETLLRFDVHHEGSVFNSFVFDGADAEGKSILAKLCPPPATAWLGTAAAARPGPAPVFGPNSADHSIAQLAAQLANNHLANNNLANNYLSSSNWANSPVDIESATAAQKHPLSIGRPLERNPDHKTEREAELPAESSTFSKDAARDLSASGFQPADADDLAHACSLLPYLLRTAAAEALVGEYLPDNPAGLTVDDVLPLLERLVFNENEELFGRVPPMPFDEAPPVIEFRPVEIADERLGDITFDEETYRPIHTSAASLVLGDDPQACPLIPKHTSRLDDADENPIRWQVVVDSIFDPDRSPLTVQYRVRYRDRDRWLTDWLPADRVAEDSDDGKPIYEAVVLRSQVPELGEVPAAFEIEVQIVDPMKQQASVLGCWTHEPMVPPLSISEGEKSMGDGSVAGLNLKEDNVGQWLELNYPLAEGLALVEFDIRNGTDAPVDVTLSFDQPTVTYQKKWQRSNAPILTLPELPDFCPDEEQCPLDFPAHHRTVVEEYRGTIKNLITGFCVYDESDPAGSEVCDESELRLRIEPRLSPQRPRTYRVRFLVNDLSFLVPQSMYEHGDDNEGPFDEVVIASESPHRITGRILREILMCAQQASTVCPEAEIYTYYVAITNASLNTDWFDVYIDSQLAIRLPGLQSQMSMPVNPTSRYSVDLPEVAWKTAEMDLPSLAPKPERPEQISPPNNPGHHSYARD